MSSPLTRLWRALTTALAALVVAGTVFAYMGAPSVEELGAAAPGRPVAGVRKPAADSGSRRAEGDQPAEGASRAVWVAPARRVPSGRMTIPAIGVQTPFYVGVHRSVVDLGPGLWPGTPLPGRRGNAVFAGHRTTHSRPFEDLDLLRPGDVVATRVRGGRRTTFRVLGIEVVTEDEYETYVLQDPAHPGARLITLFACAPKGYRTHRIVVRARARAADNGWMRGGAAPHPAG
ncbi:MAG TPA: class E sortase [Actinomycetota bacterium]|nr:class E sortase [Actinomycetota bacterium]